MIMVIYFIFDGVTEIGYSYSKKPIGCGLYMLMNGIAGLLFGGLISYKWSKSSNYVLGIYLGVKLIVDGKMLSLTVYTIQKSGGKI
jgi:uncharacterized membrane protein HdeD (DUF308 family)